MALQSAIEAKAISDWVSASDPAIINSDAMTAINKMITDRSRIVNFESKIFSATTTIEATIDSQGEIMLAHEGGYNLQLSLLCHELTMAGYRFDYRFIKTREGVGDVIKIQVAWNLAGDANG